MVNILIGCTGSVASIKLPVLAEKLIGEVSKHHSKHVCVSTPKNIARDI